MHIVYQSEINLLACDYFLFYFLQDSTLGLVSRNEENLGQHVENYKKLFENLEACVQGNASSGPAASTLLAILAITIVYITHW